MTSSRPCDPFRRLRGGWSRTADARAATGSDAPDLAQSPTKPPRKQVPDPDFVGDYAASTPDGIPETDLRSGRIVRMPTSAARVAPAPSITYRDVLSDDGTRLTAWTNDADGTIDGPTVVLCNGLGTGPWTWPGKRRGATAAPRWKPSTCSWDKTSTQCLGRMAGAGMADRLRAFLHPP